VVQRPVSDLLDSLVRYNSSPRQQEHLLKVQQLPFVWAFLEFCYSTQISLGRTLNSQRVCTYFLPSSCDPEAFLNSPDPP